MDAVENDEEERSHRSDRKQMESSAGEKTHVHTCTTFSSNGKKKARCVIQLGILRFCRPGKLIQVVAKLTIQIHTHTHTVRRDKRSRLIQGFWSCLIHLFATFAMIKIAVAEIHILADFCLSTISTEEK